VYAEFERSNFSVFCCTFVEKTELYLELFGNSLVRRQCMDYVEKMAPEFIKCVSMFLHFYFVKEM